MNRCVQGQTAWRVSPRLHHRKQRQRRSWLDGLLWTKLLLPLTKSSKHVVQPWGGAEGPCQGLEAAGTKQRAQTLGPG